MKRPAPTRASRSRAEKNRRLADHFREGRRPALARAISMVEGGRPGVAGLLQDLLLARPRARRLGVTGPPGAGKSSLIAALATLLRARDEEVAIVAVDPTSPFSGGALLGDRIRMNDLSTDPGIFIRSMATRGSLGGLAATTREVIDLLDAFGFPNILIETVGVGQTELEVASTADSVAVVLVPESGDGIQAMKAGLMEIADLFVVNKSDRIGADRMVRAIRQALLLKAGRGGRNLPAHHGVDLSRVQGGAAGRADADSRTAPGRRRGNGPPPRPPRPRAGTSRCSRPPPGAERASTTCSNVFLPTRNTSRCRERWRNVAGRGPGAESGMSSRGGCGRRAGGVPRAAIRIFRAGSRRSRPAAPLRMGWPKRSCPPYSGRDGIPAGRSASPLSVFARLQSTDCPGRYLKCRRPNAGCVAAPRCSPRSRTAGGRSSA